MMEDKELRSALEAILFVASEPVSLGDLAEALPGEAKERIEQQLDELGRSLEQVVGGFGLEKAAGGYRLVSRPEFDPVLRKFFAKRGEGRLSMAALETLAMIAYRQPVTGPEVSELRGVNSTGVLRTLLERRLIRIAGRKNVVGSPFLYRTTKEFLLHFGLDRIQDLPQLEEFTEILGENAGEELFGDLQSVAEPGDGESEEATGVGAAAQVEPEEIDAGGPREQPSPSIDEETDPDEADLPVE